MGQGQVPYLYTNTAEIRLVFEKDGCLPTYRTAHINYTNGTDQHYYLEDAVLKNFNLNYITVSSTGEGSFLSVSDAIEYLREYVLSGAYNGENVRIFILPGIHQEDIDISPLASLNIPNFTLQKTIARKNGQ